MVFLSIVHPVKPRTFDLFKDLYGGVSEFLIKLPLCLNFVEVIFSLPLPVQGRKKSVVDQSGGFIELGIYIVGVVVFGGMISA